MFFCDSRHITPYSGDLSRIKKTESTYSPFLSLRLSLSFSWFLANVVRPLVLFSSPKLTQPTARWTYGHITQPNPYPTKPLYVEQELACHKNEAQNCKFSPNEIACQYSIKCYAYTRLASFAHLSFQTDDPTKILDPSPTQSTAKCTHGHMTQPNPYPTEPPYIDQQWACRKKVSLCKSSSSKCISKRRRHRQYHQQCCNRPKWMFSQNELACQYSIQS